MPTPRAEENIQVTQPSVEVKHNEIEDATPRAAATAAAKVKPKEIEDATARVAGAEVLSQSEA